MTKAVDFERGDEICARLGSLGEGKIFSDLRRDL